MMNLTSKDRVEIERFQREISKKSTKSKTFFETSVFVDDVEIKERHNIRQIGLFQIFLI